LIDVALRPQEIDGLGNPVVAGLDQRTFREEHILLDVERGEIALDHFHHHGDCPGAHSWQPLRFAHAKKLVAMLGCEHLPHGLQIVSGIEALRDRADVFAERLAVAEECGACEHIDLGAGIVDVVFACDIVAGEIQEACERVAEHRAPAMTDMHRPGRIGRDIFDIDLRARGGRAPAEGLALP
jgi:hypothetical protein